VKTYQKVIAETKKYWSEYKKKSTQELFEKTYNRCVKEGKVDWDNPKKPLQSGLTPREKNRAKRISLGVENPNKVSFGGKSWDISDKDYERYGKLKMAHDDEKGKKTPRGKRHEFGLFKVGSLTSVAPKGEIRRQQKDHKNIKTKLNSKLYKNDERQKVYHQNDLKEPKEEFEFDLYDYELEESSTGERSGRGTRGNVTLARGRGADMDRQERSTAAIAKKAGLKGTGKYSTKDLRTKAKDYTTNDSEDDEDDYGSTEQDHYIRTYSSARKAAKGEQLIKKFKRAGTTLSGWTKLKSAPSSESVRRVKDLKKQMTKAGADKKGKVHNVDIMPRDSGVGKGDPDGQMQRGRNFIAAVKDTPKHLKAAGAKKGESVVGKPTAVMPGEDMKTGEAKRAKLYKKVFGKKSTEKSAKTGLMVGKVDEDYIKEMMTTQSVPGKAGFSTDADDMGPVAGRSPKMFFLARKFVKKYGKKGPTSQKKWLDK
jgi:hypothetical protein